MALRTSAVLAVNHVFEIVSLWFNTKDWKHALDKVIPERKQQSNKPAVVKVKNLAKVADEESKEWLNLINKTYGNRKSTGKKSGVFRDPAYWLHPSG